MMRRDVKALLTVAAVVVFTLGGFALVEIPVRVAETWTSVHIVSVLAPKHFVIVHGTGVLESPFHSSAFLDVVTPSCSSASSLVSVAALSALIRRGSPARRLLATSVALVVIFTGNVIRLTSVFAVGLFEGRAVLIMFHNWVSSIFSAAFTLGGFVLIVYLLLDKKTSTPTTRATKEPIHA